MFPSGGKAGSPGLFPAYRLVSVWQDFLCLSFLVGKARMPVAFLAENGCEISVSLSKALARCLHPLKCSVSVSHCSLAPFGRPTIASAHSLGEFCDVESSFGFVIRKADQVGLLTISRLGSLVFCEAWEVSQIPFQCHPSKPIDWDPGGQVSVLLCASAVFLTARANLAWCQISPPGWSLSSKAGSELDCFHKFYKVRSEGVWAEGLPSQRSPEWLLWETIKGNPKPKTPRQLIPLYVSLNTTMHYRNRLWDLHVSSFGTSSVKLEVAINYDAKWLAECWCCSKARDVICPLTQCQPPGKISLKEDTEIRSTLTPRSVAQQGRRWERTKVPARIYTSLLRSPALHSTTGCHWRPQALTSGSIEIPSVDDFDSLFCVVLESQVHKEKPRSNMVNSIYTGVNWSLHAKYFLWLLLIKRNPFTLSTW